MVKLVYFVKLNIDHSLIESLSLRIWLLVADQINFLIDCSFGGENCVECDWTAQTLICWKNLRNCVKKWAQKNAYKFLKGPGLFTTYPIVALGQNLYKSNYQNII